MRELPLEFFDSGVLVGPERDVQFSRHDRSIQFVADDELDLVHDVKALKGAP